MVHVAAMLQAVRTRMVTGLRTPGVASPLQKQYWRPTPEKNIKTMPCWGKKIAQGISSWTWDVTHERALSPADLFGGKAPVGALIGLLERIC